MYRYATYINALIIVQICVLRIPVYALRTYNMRMVMYVHMSVILPSMASALNVIISRALISKLGLEYLSLVLFHYCIQCILYKYLLVSFNNFTELQVMIDRLQTKRMKQGSLSVVLYETCRSIKMHNVTEHYEEEYIVMYFETGKRSGGGAIESVQMLGEGEIVIIFKDPKGMPQVTYFVIKNWG